MMQGIPTPEYEARLRTILSARDWQGLREFARARKSRFPTRSTKRIEHFWEVMLHKIICNRIDMLAEHAAGARLARARRLFHRYRRLLARA